MSKNIIQLGLLVMQIGALVLMLAGIGLPLTQVVAIIPWAFFAGILL